MSVKKFDLDAARQRRDDLLALSLKAHAAVIEAGRGASFADRATGRATRRRDEARYAASVIDEQLRLARFELERLESLHAALSSRALNALHDAHLTAAASSSDVHEESL